MQVGFFILGTTLLITSVALAILVSALAIPRSEQTDQGIWPRFHHFIRYFSTNRRLRPAYLAVCYLAFTGVIWVAFSLVLGTITEQLRAWQVMDELLKPLIIFSPPLLFSMLINDKRMS
jgi:hypothetical protein